MLEVLITTVSPTRRISNDFARATPINEPTAVAPTKVNQCLVAIAWRGSTAKAMPINMNIRPPLAAILQALTVTSRPPR